MMTPTKIIQKETEYQRYLRRLRQCPEALILVRGENGNLKTFANDAVLAAGRLGLPVMRIDRHRVVEFSQDMIDALMNGDTLSIAYA